MESRLKPIWTEEMRAQASEKAKKNWRESRARRIQGQNSKGAMTSIKRLRLMMTELKGWNQSDFGEALGLSRKNQSRVSQLENGLCLPTPSQIERMKEIAEQNDLSWTYTG